MNSTSSLRFACILVTALCAWQPAIAHADEVVVDDGGANEVELTAEPNAGDFDLVDGDPGTEPPGDAGLDEGGLPDAQDLGDIADDVGTVSDGLEDVGALDNVDLTDFGGDDGAAFAGTEGDYAVDDGVHDGVDLPVVDDCGEACMFYTTGLPDNAVEGEARGVTADFAADLDTFDSAADYLDTGPDDALAAEPRSPHTALLVPAAPVTAPTLIRGGKLHP